MGHLKHAIVLFALLGCQISSPELRKKAMARVSEDEMAALKSHWTDITIVEPVDWGLILKIAGTVLAVILFLFRNNARLKQSLEEINTISGLIPICASCKKIRDDKGYWNLLEAYIEKHSDASFSHGICPECSDRTYGGQDWYVAMKNKNPSKS